MERNEEAAMTTDSKKDPGFRPPMAEIERIISADGPKGCRQNDETKPISPRRKRPQAGTTGGTACPTTEDQQLTKLVGQAFSMSELQPRAPARGEIKNA